jgi:hypothetical protein
VARVFAPKVELVTSAGTHLRYITAALAKAMVSADAATIHNENGKVKAIRLVRTAAVYLQVIGPPSGDWKTPPFCVREKLEGGFVVWRHHRRSTDE